jgi:hypothetical protein
MDRARKESTSQTVILLRSVSIQPSARTVCSVFATPARDGAVQPPRSSWVIGFLPQHAEPLQEGTHDRISGHQAKERALCCKGVLWVIQASQGRSLREIAEGRMMGA